MADSPQRPDENMANRGSGGPPPAGDASAGDASQIPQPTQIAIDDSKTVASYANFCRVTGTPEEVLIDFGINEHPFGAQSHSLPITQRIITNYYTAKRLLQVLHMTIERYEATFGVLETDVQKRARPGGGRPPQRP